MAPTAEPRQQHDGRADEDDGEDGENARCFRPQRSTCQRNRYRQCRDQQRAQRQVEPARRRGDRNPGTSPYLCDGEGDDKGGNVERDGVGDTPLNRMDGPGREAPCADGAKDGCARAGARCQDRTGGQECCHRGMGRETAERAVGDKGVRTVDGHDHVYRSHGYRQRCDQRAPERAGSFRRDGRANDDDNGEPGLEEQ